MITADDIEAEIMSLKKLVYEPCGFVIANLKLNNESSEYSACSFELNGHTIEYRMSKITPTKAGQFVTIWKRNDHGLTAPFDIADKLDFIVITSKKDNRIGQFIFPKNVLAEKGIISQTGKDGKRGIRVYPPWDEAGNKQAEKTQRWQLKYFVSFEAKNSDFFGLTKHLFGQ